MQKNVIVFQYCFEEDVRVWHALQISAFCTET